MGLVGIKRLSLDFGLVMPPKELSFLQYLKILASLSLHLQNHTSVCTPIYIGVSSANASGFFCFFLPSIPWAFRSLLKPALTKISFFSVNILFFPMPLEIIPILCRLLPMACTFFQMLAQFISMLRLFFPMLAKFF